MTGSERRSAVSFYHSSSSPRKTAEFYPPVLPDLSLCIENKRKQAPKVAPGTGKPAGNHGARVLTRVLPTAQPTAKSAEGEPCIFALRIITCQLTPVKRTQFKNSLVLGHKDVPDYFSWSLLKLFSKQSPTEINHSGVPL